MIKAIKLRNFESHKNTTIVLSESTNAIVGESEHGKSAIIRAVYWVAFNRPSGNEFRSTWTQELRNASTSVSIELDNGVIITREKNSKGNYYFVEKEGKKKKTLKGFGQNRPKEVADLLGLSALNFQTQFDPHFLLPPVSPGETARKLNEIVNLQIIDKAQSNINSTIRETKRKMSASVVELSDWKKQKEELTWTKDAAIDLSEIEDVEHTIKGLRKKQLSISNAVYNYNEVNKELKAFAFIEKAEKELNSVTKAVNEKQSYTTKATQLSDILDELEQVLNEITSLDLELNKQEKEFKIKFPKECPLCGSVIKKQ